MSEPFERAQELFATFEAEVRKEVPAGADIFDAHTHLGDDIDGMAGRYDDLIAVMDRYGVSRCNVFCLDEPDRQPAFRAGNDRTLEAAGRSNGRLIPFVRLDLTEDPIAEAERCLDRGARGIKLHPRAQKFMLDDERLAPVFAIAAERRVPILIHGGRGLPPIADNLARLVDRYPDAQLIIAHAGIADLSGLAGHFAGKAGVFFDTSVWSPIDLLSFFRLV
ncbi:MAG TPA: amidohydrolase family protein, partial [Gaiellaceae bacterium]